MWIDGKQRVLRVLRWLLARVLDLGTVILENQCSKVILAARRRVRVGLDKVLVSRLKVSTILQSHVAILEIVERLHRCEV